MLIVLTDESAVRHGILQAGFDNLFLIVKILGIWSDSWLDKNESLLASTASLSYSQLLPKDFSHISKNYKISIRLVVNGPKPVQFHFNIKSIIWRVGMKKVNNS